MGRKRKGAGGRRGPTRSQSRAGLVGTISVTGSGGFVDTAEGSFKLTQRGLREAMHGDRVTVGLVRGPHGHKRAVVEGVIERATASIVGTFEPLGPLSAVRPIDSRITHDFFVLPSDDSPARVKAQRGDIVVAHIVSYPARNESGVVTLERRVGSEDAPDLGVQCIMARYDLAEGYPDPAEREAAAMRLDVTAALADPLRQDIRDRFVVTIDPVDARDFDDAISVSRTEDGGWRLGVHIADVSHYVPWGSSVDLEARRRSTSVYLADRVLPMLPERLCNNLCSLRPDEDRLAMTVDMLLDERGRVRRYRSYPSVIRSRVRMDYAAADVLLAGGEGDAVAGAPGVEVAGAPATPAVPAPDAIPAASPVESRAAAMVAAARACGVDLAAFLRDADALAQARRRIRRRRGAIDFETTEVHAVLDASGMPIDLVARHRTPATSLVEEAMLLANECVAEQLAEVGAPAAYRVHEPPTPDHLAAAAQVLEQAGALDHEAAEDIALGDPHAIERAVEAAHGTGFESIANALLLRAMQRAVYKPDNEGHYALGAAAYCHFTSPIRRYPDLLVHRALKMLLAGEKLGRRRASERAPQLTGTGDQCLERIVPQLCRHASERERIADAAGHASQKVKAAQYYASRIGERVGGTISWMDASGIFVQLDGTGVEGRVRISDIGREWWEFDERALKLTGTATGRVIELGQRLIVEVERVNVLRGHIDLALADTGADGALH